MGSSKARTATEGKFSVVSVEKTERPPGITEGNWCRYVIERDGSTIVGSRRGTVQQVRSHAAGFAEELNARAVGRRNTTWTSRQKK